MKKIYFIIRNDEVIVSDNFGLPKIWINKVSCEAMCSQLNSISQKHNLLYTFRIIESESID